MNQMWRAEYSHLNQSSWSLRSRTRMSRWAWEGLWKVSALTFLDPEPVMGKVSSLVEVVVMEIQCWYLCFTFTCLAVCHSWMDSSQSHKKANHPQALSDPCLLDFFAEGQDVWLRPLQGDEGQENGKCGKNTKCLKYVSQVSKQSGFRLFLRFKHWNPQLWYFLPVKHALWGCTVTIYTHG